MVPSEPVAEHKALAPSADSVRVALVTASDSRTPDTNDGGRVLRRLIEESGFQVTSDSLLAEEPSALRDAVARLARESDAVIVTGGTGIAPRDRTPDAVGALFERRLPGFGELFRWLSFQEIGPAAMLSRADAGVVDTALVFLLPGSPAAVELAVRRLIAPELAHAVGQLRRGGGGAHSDRQDHHHHHRHER
jgi:molybdenum cofactor biosynthesis protein B